MTAMPEGVCPHTFSVTGWSLDPVTELWVDAGNEGCRLPSRATVQGLTEREGGILL